MPTIELIQAVQICLGNILEGAAGVASYLKSEPVPLHATRLWEIRYYDIPLQRVRVGHNERRHPHPKLMLSKFQFKLVQLVIKITKVYGAHYRLKKEGDIAILRPIERL